MKWHRHRPFSLLVGCSRKDDWMTVHLVFGFFEFQITNASRDWRGSVVFLFGIAAWRYLWFGPLYVDCRSRHIAP